MAKKFPTNEFKAAVKALNKVLKEAEKTPIKFVGVKREEIVENFTNVIIDYREQDIVEQLPDEAINFYNNHIASTEEDDSADEKKDAKKGKKSGKKADKKADKKEKKAKKAKKPAGPKVGYEIIRAIVDNDNSLDREKVLDEVVKVFPDREKSGMKTTVNHVVGVMTNYFKYVKSLEK